MNTNNSQSVQAEECDVSKMSATVKVQYRVGYNHTRGSGVYPVVFETLEKAKHLVDDFPQAKILGEYVIKETITSTMERVDTEECSQCKKPFFPTMNIPTSVCQFCYDMARKEGDW